MIIAASQASAWFSLAGVVVGGLLGTALTLFRDWRRRKHDADTARKLVSADLSTIERALKDAEDNLRRSRERDPAEPPNDNQQWPVGWETATWAQRWAGYSPSLAASMDDREFGPLATAFGFIEQLQHSLAAGRRPFQSDDPTFLENVREAVTEARDSLRS
jgi:hypothetical protein